MKKVINVILGICVIGLLFICYRSIKDTENFDATVAARENVVKARLMQIRDAEEAYKAQHDGVYCADWNVLIDFVKNGKLPFVKKQGVLTEDQMNKGLTESKAAAIVNSGDEVRFVVSIGLGFEIFDFGAKFSLGFQHAFPRGGVEGLVIDTAGIGYEGDFNAVSESSGADQCKHSKH